MPPASAVKNAITALEDQASQRREERVFLGPPGTGAAPTSISATTGPERVDRDEPARSWRSARHRSRDRGRQRREGRLPATGCGSRPVYGMSAATVAALAQRFEVLGPASPGDIEVLVTAYGDRIRGIATTGKARFDRALLQRLPALEIVACYSAGLDNIDTEALAERGIALTNSSVALADDVADLAIVLMVTARRQLVAADAHSQRRLGKRRVE